MSSDSTGNNNNSYNKSKINVATVRDRANTLDLRYGIQLPSSGTPERWLAMCNGRTEWLEKYSSLADDLGISPSTGYVGFDHRGQGASGGARAWIDNYTVFATDLADMIEASTKGQPYNLVCHSMGCVIGLTAIMEGFIQPRCVVLSGPMLGLPNVPMPAPWAYKVAKAMCKVGLGHVGTGGGKHHLIPFEHNILTHSAERYSLIQNTPFPVPSATFEWVKASYEATQAVLQPEKLKRLTMPVLVLCGTDEQVVDINAVQPWVQAAQEHAQAAVELQWVQGGRHELLFESREYYEKALGIIRQWFNKVGFPV